MGPAGPEGPVGIGATGPPVSGECSCAGRECRIASSSNAVEHLCFPLQGRDGAPGSQGLPGADGRPVSPFFL